MNRIRGFARCLVLAVVSLAVSSAPLARVFARRTPVPRSALMGPADGAGSAARFARAVPRARRPKQALVAVQPKSDPSAPAAAAARRPVPAREPSAAVASFAALPDHPPS